MRRRTALAVAAGATAFLVLAGGGTALAAWTASAQLHVQASTASVGLSQSHDAGALATTYDPADGATLMASAPFTVVNDGSREAAYTVSFAVESTTIPALPSRIRIAVGTVADETSCTTDAALTGAQSGTLASLTSYGGSLAAHAAAVLCIQTSISEDDANDSGATSLQLAMTPALTYAAGDAWTVTGTPVTVTQSVASTLLFFTNPSGRYVVRAYPSVGAQCVYQNQNWALASPNNCDTSSWQNQWRLSQAGGSWHVNAAVNSTVQPTDPRWQDQGDGNMITAVTPPQGDTDPQRLWTIVGRGDDRYAIVNAKTGLCATWIPPWPDYTDPSRPGLGWAASLITAPCDAGNTAQSFSFSVVGTPVPPTPYVMTCSGNGSNYLMLGVPQNQGYQGEADYRILIDGVIVKDIVDGYNPYWQAYNDDAALRAYVAQHGYGVKSVVEQQTIDASANWDTYATGSIDIVQTANGFDLTCP